MVPFPKTPDSKEYNITTEGGQSQTPRVAQKFKDKKKSPGVNYDQAVEAWVEKGYTKEQALLLAAGKCLYCKEKGHKKSDCLTNPANKKGKNAARRPEPKNMPPKKKLKKSKLVKPANDCKYSMAILKFLPKTGRFITTLFITIFTRLTPCRTWLDTGADVSLGDIDFFSKLPVEFQRAPDSRLKGFGGSEEVKEYVVIEFIINNVNCLIRLFLVNSRIFRTAGADVCSEETL